MRSRLFWGVDYYPEHWPEARWPHDADAMVAAHFNVVRLAEFAWSLLEPTDGHFDFGWLDRAIDVLAERGLQIVVGTPSASIPPWLFAAHPDMVIVDADGIRRTYGSRRDGSPASPVYRDYAARIARKMAAHYADHPAVIGWQIDNEFGDRDYSSHAQAGFHEWLKARYPSLDALNQAWGTRFWSHVYTDWAQIPVPRQTTHARHNPGLHLDYDRYLSDCYVAFQQAQIDAIREVVPQTHFITHNLMGFTYADIDYFDLAAPLDVVSWDNYPSAFWRENPFAVPADVALNHAAMWGLKQSNFWVMEQQSGPSGWHIVGPMPRPGQVALWAWQAIAHGANGIVFFRWRTNPRGAEQNWHGILHADGTRTRRYQEIQKMGEALTPLMDQIAATEPFHDIALIHDYDIRFSFQIHPDNPLFSYEQHVADYFHAIHDDGRTAAVLSVEADWDDYPLVLAPALRIVDEALVRRLTAYVEAGGILVLTMRSGSRDRTNALVETPFPGLLADLCGVTVRESDSLAKNDRKRVRFGENEAYATMWCDVIDPTTADVIATYAEDFYTDEAAVSLQRRRKGAVVYVGTAGDAMLVQQILAKAIELAQIPLMSDIQIPDGVEMTRRRGDNGVLIFVLNHNATEAVITLNHPHHEQMTNAVIDEVLLLPPYGVAVLQKVIETATHNLRTT
ncbi:MAG: beta-galactosidase [Aggregatilineales bacterium]